MRDTHRRSSVKGCLKQFAEIHSKTSGLKSLFNKFAVLMVYNFIRKKLRQRRCLVSFLKFLKRPILQNKSERMLEWNESKNYSQESNGKDVLFSEVAEMWAYSFYKRDSITDAFLWKLWSFTESHFYRTLLCDCFWFPVTFSVCHLFYQQKIVHS